MTAALDPLVALVRTDARYAPPSAGDAGRDPVTAALVALGLDVTDPFGRWVGPGATVTLKPNWVMHANPLGHDLDSLVTHPTVLEVLAGHVARALRGQGTLVIGDAPLQGCDFATLMQRLGIAELAARLRARHPALEVVIEDWRLTRLRDARSLGGPDQDIRDLQGEPEGYARVDLGTESFLEEIAEYSDRFRVTCYPPSAMSAHHMPGRHEYLVSRRVLASDLVINVPKLKTHIKAGLTGALKNLVGINGHKEFLPHHIRGGWDDGGDCYPRGGRLREVYDRIYDYTWEHLPALGRVERTALWGALRVMGRINRGTGDGVDAGSWSGNETIWRTTLDLNHVLYRRGRARVLHVVDGIVAGQGEGPLMPEPVPAGVVLAGANPAHVDAVIARLIGYNLARIPTVYHALTHRRSHFAGAEPQAIPLRIAPAPGAAAEPAVLAEVSPLHFEVPVHWRRALAHRTRSEGRHPVASGEW